MSKYNLEFAGNQSIRLYDYEGNMIWENNKLTGKIAYQEDNNLICVLGGIREYVF